MDVPGPGECGRVPTPTESKKRAAIPAATLSGVERDPRGQRRILLVPRPGISRSLAQRRQPGRQSRPRDPQHGGSPRLERNQVLDGAGAGLRLLDVVQPNGGLKATPTLEANVFKGNKLDQPVRGVYKMPGAP